MPCAGAAQVPAGSLPRTMEVVLRNEQVEQARAGDKLVFTGNLVVVPDIAMLTIPGERVQVGRRGAHALPGLAPPSPLAGAWRRPVTAVRAPRAPPLSLPCLAGASGASGADACDAGTSNWTHSLRDGASSCRGRMGSLPYHIHWRRLRVRKGSTGREGRGAWVRRRRRRGGWRRGHHRHQGPGQPRAHLPPLLHGLLRAGTPPSRGPALCFCVDVPSSRPPAVSTSQRPC